MAFKKKAVPKTTNNLTTGIENFYKSKGHSVSRINTQGQFEPVNKYHRFWTVIEPAIRLLKSYGLVAGSWRKSGSRVGFFDLCICVRPIGIMLVIDIKNDGDSPSKEQLQFRDEVTLCGGKAVFIESMEMNELFYNEEIMPLLQ